MKKIKKMLLYLIIMTLAFYLLPLLIIDTGSGMFILLLVIPIICLIVPFIYGIRNSFNLLFTLLVMLLFAPTIFIFYNKSASVYIVAYGMITLTGNFLGSLFHKKNKE